jgi:uncharacterized protein YjbI with pentapeptide repeats
VKRWELGAPFDASGALIDPDSLRLLVEVLDSMNDDSRAAPLRADRTPVFLGEVRFENAVFLEEADFHNVTFRGPAYFHGAVFRGRADFRRTQFLDHADFDEATFNGSANFRGAVFVDHAGFEKARVKGANAVFAATEFGGDVDLEEAIFNCDLELTNAVFEATRRLGPFFVGKTLWIDGCVFTERVAIEVRAEAISAASSVFPEGARVSVLGADINLEGADFGRGSTVTSFSVEQPPLPSHTSDSQEKGPKRPRLLSVQGAQIALLSLSGLDIGDCHFFGAHGLESLNIEPSCVWRHTPNRWRCIDREMIAEELTWRSGNAEVRRFCVARRSGIRLWGSVPQGGDSAHRRMLDPMQLAALYRALRKAREDNKDRAGAGDLYYGEMEMRRLAPLPTGRGRIRRRSDRLVISLYWVLSGYGLRAGRAFVSLVLLVLAGAWLFRQFGITPEPSVPRALLFSFESACSLVRIAHLPKGYELRGSGEVVQVALRVLGPLLLGLWLLAIRSRVRR